MSVISSRKEEHVKVAMGEAADYQKGSGFGDVEFVHCALPELDLGNIDTKTTFLGREFSAPLAIEGMTGGYPNAKAINARLAAAADVQNVIFGVGSQRAMLKHPEMADTFKVRHVAPHVFLIGNIGAVQLGEYAPAAIEAMIKDIDANALAIHLNPLQEAVQPEGDINFEGCAARIEALCDELDVPVIVKETGAGISASVAKKLKNAGVGAINVSGSGGTSWSRVEYERGKDGSGKHLDAPAINAHVGAMHSAQPINAHVGMGTQASGNAHIGGAQASGTGVRIPHSAVPGFEDWGIPTVESIVQCSGILPLISSGGIRCGIDAAKSIALGAEMAGAAKPFLLAENPEKKIGEWKAQMATAMFLTGCKNIAALKKAPLIITGRTKDALLAIGIDVQKFGKRA
jgi:isopentenyl-diphosphate delta-isomerase